MGIFKSILKFVAPNFVAKIDFDSYLDRVQFSLEYCEVVSFDPPSEIISTLEYLKCDKEANKERIKRFNKLKRETVKHNDEVSLVNSVIRYNRLTYQRILDDPFSISDKAIANANATMPIIEKFLGLDDKCLEYRDHIGPALLDIETVKKTKELHKACLEEMSFSGRPYIDRNEKVRIKEKLNNLKGLISDRGFEYYDFSGTDSVDFEISKHNDEYVKWMSTTPILDDVNGRSLDMDQRMAVVGEEVSSLTIAGAGSGKTLTICGKVKYLLEHNKVDPSEILLLSYANKSSSDLESKVSKINPKITVGTFHKLGLEVLKECNNTSYMVETQFNEKIETFFREEMPSRPDFMRKVLEYFALYLFATSKDKKYKDDGELFEDLKRMDFKSLKQSLLEMSNNPDKRETIKKEFVKSYEEMAIANWYFLNGIGYDYEEPYEFEVATRDKRQYTPDFKLKGFPVYHEHYGINEDGRATQYKNIEAFEYEEGVRWKRNLHLQNGTDCIETYSYEFKDGTIFKKLEEELIKRGIRPNPLTPEQIKEAVYSIYQGQNFKSFISLIRSFISLYKSRWTDASHFDELKKTVNSSTIEKQRSIAFIDIAKQAYLYYTGKLKETGKIDFDDMILKSTQCLPDVKGFEYKYIIVDEFQDISYSRMMFLKSLISKGKSKLFAVGDDWQSIYRFSGSDLDIFVNFRKYFGEHTTNYIKTTHRNSQELQDIAGPFIKKNKEQINKTIESKKHVDKPVKIMFTNGEKYRAFNSLLEHISKQNKNTSILVLGRNNRDVEDIMYDGLYKIHGVGVDNEIELISKEFPSLKIRYSTVHSSKGLEEDIVIVINADDGRLGFPNKVEDDPLLNLVLSSSSSFPYAEERRLWYVALTRTRTYTYLLVDENNPSQFVKEIISKCEILNGTDQNESKFNPIKCPYCKSGRLILREGTHHKKFYGCSNYPYCRYSNNDLRAVDRNRRCPVCGDIVVFRKGRWGAFYGCHGFPNCDYKEKYEEYRDLK